MLPKRILTHNISLLWSSYSWVTFLFYRHSAPPELKRALGREPSYNHA